MVRILILDDDPLFGQTLRDRLRRKRPFPCEIVYVETAETAVAQVQNSDEPFHIFLIDQRLGPGPDGIAVMEQLGGLNPQADAIIFTGLNDLESGLRAIQAGAYRFLTKPFDTEELIWILRTVVEHQRMRYERDWLRILNGISQEIQQSLLADEIARHLVAGGVQLGYERVRVWRLCPANTHLRSLQFGGVSQFDHPIDLPLAESVYAQRVVASNEPQMFMGLELGPWYLDRVVERPLFPPPNGPWICVPLRTGDDRCMGMLVLDNVSKIIKLDPDHVQMLSMLGRHAAAALERAELYQTEQRKRAEMNILFQIGKKVVERSALDDLSRLLQAVREQVGRLMDVGNFMVVLIDPESGLLETRLEVQEQTTVLEERVINHHGLIGHIIRRSKGLVLPMGPAAYCREHDLTLLQPAAKSWMGSVLRMDERAIGAVVVESHDEAGAYDRDDWLLLNQVSDLIAGAIQSAQVRERERLDKEQLAILQRVSQEIMTLAEENEQWLWHAMLTAVTASYGLRFNRAMVFMLEPRSRRLQGTWGLGHLDAARARADWERDVAEGVTFDDYLRRLRADNLPELPLQAKVARFSLPWPAESGALHEVVTRQQGVLVRRDQVADCLPAAFVSEFGVADYALEPLRRGGEVVGVVAVDNIHNGKPLRLRSLAYLQPLLTQAMLTLQYLRERQTRDALLSVGHSVMAQAARFSLYETLLEIATAAQAISGADFVVINPLLSEERPFLFDLDNSVCVDGEKRPFVMKPPRQNGLTEHVLRSGLLPVEDIQTHQQSYGGRPLAEHPHLTELGLRGLIATPIHELSSGRLLGALYFLYRRPHHFGATQTKEVQLFASLTAVAIQTTRAAQSVRDDLHQARTATEVQAHELSILSNVLQEALVPDLTETKVIRALLGATALLLHQPQTRINLFLHQWQTGSNYQHTPRPMWYQFILHHGNILTENHIVNGNPGLVGHVFQTGKTLLIPDVTEEPWCYHYVAGSPIAKTRAELDIPIKAGDMVIGVLNIESDIVAAFGEAEKAAGERLAHVAGLALSNVQRQEQLHNVLRAMSAVTEPTGLQETLASIVTVLRETFPELSCLTIWYRLPRSEELILGPNFGLRDEAAVVDKLYDKDNAVWDVMQSDGPIWAESVVSEPRLHTGFAQRERVRSTAAFPLRFNDDLVGAMFLNYRTPHQFTRQEKYLFALLAQVVTASVRDAAHLEEALREKERLAVIGEIGEIVGTALEIETVLEAILVRLDLRFPHFKPYVLLYDEKERRLEMTTASLRFYPLHRSHFAHLRQVPLAEPTLVSEAARMSLISHQVQELLARNVADYVAYVPVMAETRSQLCLTLMDAGRLLGVFSLECAQLDGFTEGDVATLRGIGHQISLALERVQRSRQLQFQQTVAGAMAWASELAHEINSEVGLMRYRANWIMEDAADAAQVRQWAEEIEAGAERLVTTMAMSGTQAWRAEEEPYLLDEVLRQWVLELVHKRNVPVEVCFELGCGGVRLRWFSGALRRVVNHLVHNALDALFEDKMVLRGEKRPLLTIFTHHNGNWVEVQVRDNGPGIAEAVRQTVLQEPRSTKEGARRGYGLLFARSLIENMQGDLRLLPSEPGTGATFTIGLPINDEATTGSAAVPARKGQLGD